MSSITMQERMLRLLQGKEVDRVPFVIYDTIIDQDELYAELGQGHFGRLIWSAVHKVEHPNCRFEHEDFDDDGARWRRTTLHTPAGSIYEERAYEPVYNSSSVKKHYIKDKHDYHILWSYLDDCVIREDYARYHRDQKVVGEDGLPLVAVERTPYQQLWVEWVGLGSLPYHFADFEEEVETTIEMLIQRARKIFEIAYRSPAPFIDVPDNITAPAIGPKRFRQYCVPLYNELADGFGDVPVFVHMDGDLKPLWKDIAASRIRGLDSFSPAPDNDTTVAEAVSLFPEKILYVNFPSSVHLRSYEGVRTVAEEILDAAASTGKLQIQISENVPLGVWRNSFRAIIDAIEAWKI